jgi:hypothetical protein
MPKIGGPYQGNNTSHKLQSITLVKYNARNNNVNQSKKLSGSRDGGLFSPVYRLYISNSSGVMMLRLKYYDLILKH